MDFILKDLYTLSVFFLKQVWDFIGQDYKYFRNLDSLTAFYSYKTIASSQLRSKLSAISSGE